ncbi:class I SAM-dependent methyltransferase [Magnetospirillum sp. SS-4]|uniref:class I SAM-dependent methyltransferase n=1 Tax=Magnetospirillum sp. SS-4 TaxID=2681465 RepID=UPI001574EDDE|nr:class I SAM-dependent methyltransferase [Magnetospirillum sp. SS-4]
MTEVGLTPHQVFQQALAHQNAGELDRAEHLYGFLLECFPDNPDVNHNMGMIQALKGRPARALPYLKLAVAAGPDNVEYGLSLAGVLIQMGYMDDALEMARGMQAAIGGDSRLLDLIRRNESRPWFPVLQGVHAPERQAYMSALVHMQRRGQGPIRILEVGSFMGASLMTWATAVERLTDRPAEICCIDPWDGGDLGQYDYGGSIGQYLEDGTAHRVFRNTLKFIPDRVVVTEMRGQSQEMLPTLAGRRFDLIYLDGCHLHPEVLCDLQACDGVLAEGGVICGDDLELQLHQVDGALALANARKDSVGCPGGDGIFHPGVTLGVGRFFGPVSVYRGFWAMRKAAGGYEQVSMAGAVGMIPYHWPEEFHDMVRRNIGADGLLAGLL